LLLSVFAIPFVFIASPFRQSTSNNSSIASASGQSGSFVYCTSVSIHYSLMIIIIHLFSDVWSMQQLMAISFNSQNTRTCLLFISHFIIAEERSLIDYLQRYSLEWYTYSFTLANRAFTSTVSFAKHIRRCAKNGSVSAPIKFM